MRETRTRVCAIALMVVLVLSVISVGAAAPALADDSPPEVPAAYYGEITINGEPAPVGTEIIALVDGEERGSITVTEPGQFGGPSIDDDKLEVPGSSDDAGESVTFEVNGQELEANQAVEWESADLQEVTLTGDDIGFPFIEAAIDEAESTLEVEPNDTATVVVEIENTGDAPGESAVEFELDGDLEETVELELDDGETETVSFDVTLSEEGEYEALVRTVDDEASATISVATDDPTPAPPAPPASPDDPDEPDEPTEPPAIPVEPDPNADYSEERRAAFDPEVGASTVTFSDDSPVVSIAFQSEESIDVLVQRYDVAAPPKGVRQVPGDGLTLQRISVSEGFEKTAGTIRLTISGDDDVDTDALTAYRFDDVDGVWDPLESEVVEVDDDRIVLDVETPRFSYFAVAETAQPTAVIDVDPDTTFEEGETVTLSAENADPGSGEMESYEWTLDGAVVGDTETVDIGSNLEPGTYEVELTVTNDGGNSDSATETLTVEEGEPPADDPVGETHETEIAVTDSGGEPIAGATVEIDGETYTTDEDGVVTVELENGEYTATITADGFEDSTQDITVDGEDVAIATELASVEEDDGTSWLIWFVVLLVIVALIAGAYYVYTERGGELSGNR
ncbi:carboxypeptidase regulatory-like domain-containing protein [Halobacteria archaeon AArc-curdl1]|uniref:Carboxypeptidase regulatory-like domain-containing protein n=1 Tax=Natronosalvus hydrolyticus TaxID=2979988 RepID=A0AAP3E7M2_9EURY|nr:carboxypeptidase regulatory-like domain-containing protein [Halobacteria archaeon AArc-curdl1]